MSLVDGLREKKTYIKGKEKVTLNFGNMTIKTIALNSKFSKMTWKIRSLTTMSSLVKDSVV